MIHVENLRRTYGKTVAVDDVSFEVRPGEIYGLLGPNGAGKTTTISVISGLLAATSGRVLVEGRPIGPEAKALKEGMGIVPQETAIYEDLTARESLAFWGGIYGLRGSRLRERVVAVLDQVGLTDRADEAAKTYSGGMKRRLNLAIGLVHEPRVVLLDEPTVGVDPQARIAILDVVRAVARAGATVLYTTHYMQEAEDLCDRIGIMDHGRILAEGNLGTLKRMVGEGEILTLRGGFHAEEIRSRLDGWPDLEVVRLEDHHVMLSVKGGRPASEVLGRVFQESIAVDQIALQAPSLEQVFIKLTGRELRD